MRPTSWSPRRPAGTAACQLLRRGIATPADAALMMQLGCDGNFVAPGSSSPRTAAEAKAIVTATNLLHKPDVLLEASTGLGQAMRGLEIGRSHGGAPRRPRLVRDRDVAGPRVGVLALQGAFREHIAALRELGADAFPLRTEAELETARRSSCPWREHDHGQAAGARPGCKAPLARRLRRERRHSRPAPA